MAGLPPAHRSQPMEALIPKGGPYGPPFGVVGRRGWCVLTLTRRYADEPGPLPHTADRTSYLLSAYQQRTPLT
jgi:hypothetical protein